MTNCNPDTGIRCGVIALNNLDPDTAHWLWCRGTNVSLEEAYEQIKSDARGEWEAELDEANTAAYEVDAHMRDTEREEFIYRHMMEKTGYDDVESYVDAAVERAHIEIDEPLIQGECEGVKYQISHLGGAALLWVLEGPIGYAKRLCSPCVPNAADLDGGFARLEDEGYVWDDYPYHCYVVPQDWLPKER